MTVESWSMAGAGVAALLVGYVQVQPRFRAASGAGKVLVWGPVFAATSLAMFSAEHFTAAQSMVGIVPRWLPGHLFWIYFFGVAMALAAISFVLWRGVRWSAPLLALFFLLIVTMIHLPNAWKGPHDRFLWILVVRETCFAGGAMVLAGHCLGQTRFAPTARAALVGVGRFIVGATMIFYGIEQFLFPRNVPGVPLPKLTPSWIPTPVLIADFVGAVLLIAGVALVIGRGVRVAAAIAGSVLVLLVLFFYIPIFFTETHSSLAVEGLNYIGDTLLFAASVLLAGWGAQSRAELGAGVVNKSYRAS